MVVWLFYYNEDAKVRIKRDAAKFFPLEMSDVRDKLLNFARQKEISR